MKKFNLKQTGMTAAGLVAGSVLGNVIVSKLPASVSNPKLRAAVPLVAGIFLSMQKSDMIKNVGYGLIANGGSKVLGTFVPSLAGVTGVGDDIFGVYDEIVNGVGDDEINGDDDGLGDDDMNGVLNGVLNGPGDGDDN